VLRIAEISRKKYLFYLFLALITSGAFWWISDSPLNALAILLMFMLCGAVEFICDLRGYFGAPTAHTKVGLVRKVIGYLIGTFIFMVLFVAVMRLLQYVLKLIGINL
jgi:hypothetical protein